MDGCGCRHARCAGGHVLLRAMRKCTALPRRKPVCVQERAHSAAKAATGAACSLLEAALAEAAACAATGAPLGGGGARGVRVQ